MSGEGGISGSKFDIEIFQCPNEETNKGRLGFGGQKWVLEYQIATYFEEVKHMKKKHYEKIVFEKVQIEAFQCLKNKIKSKGSVIDYGTRIVMQNYLKPLMF